MKWICIMRMLEFKRTKLFDGVEYELFNKEFLLNIEGKSLSFIADDITQFKLIDYQGKQEIIYELLLKSEGNSDIITKEGLQVYYLSKGARQFVCRLRYLERHHRQTHPHHAARHPRLDTSTTSQIV